MLFVLVSEKQSRLAKGKVRCIDLVSADSKEHALTIAVEELDLSDWDVQCIPFAEAEAVLEKLVLSETDHCFNLVESERIN